MENKIKTGVRVLKSVYLHGGKYVNNKDLTEEVGLTRFATYSICKWLVTRGLINTELLRPTGRVGCGRVRTWAINENAMPRIRRILEESYGPMEEIEL